MGFPIILHYVANQPHTPSPHFAIFPTRLPDYLFKVLFLLHLCNIMNPPFHPPSVCHSTNFPSFHLPHIEYHPWGPHPPPVLQANCALPGPTILHWGTHFYICTLIPNYSLFYCTNAFVSNIYITFLSSPLATFFLANATHVTLGWGTPYHLPSTTSSISSKYPTGHLPMPSEFVHFVSPLAQLIPCLIVPLTLDLVEWLRPLFTSHIPPTKGSIESSYILTSSMYLFQIPDLT
jgi:hypothetical protein